MSRRNNTNWLDIPDSGQRIKRSADPNEYYQSSRSEDGEYLEVAANVVFERLRRSTDDNEIYDKTGKLMTDSRATYDLVGNEVVRSDIDYYSAYETNRVRRQAPASADESSRDLNYKQLVFDEPTAQTVDFHSIAKQNRPADVLEYKRFLKVSFLMLPTFFSLFFC